MTAVTQTDDHPKVGKAKETVKELFDIMSRVEQTVNRFELSLMNIYSLNSKKMMLDDVDVYPLRKALESQYSQSSLLVEPIKEMTFALFEVKRGLVSIANGFTLTTEEIEELRKDMPENVKVGDFTVEYLDPNNRRNKLSGEDNDDDNNNNGGFFEWKQ